MIRQQGDEIPGCDAFSENESRAIGDARSCESSRQQHLRIVRRHAHWSINPRIQLRSLDSDRLSLLDVSLDTPLPLNLARVPLKTRLRLYGNP